MNAAVPNVGLELPRYLSPFQVLIRLQYLRAQIREWVRGSAEGLRSNEIQEILWTLRGLATTARATGLDAYSTICLHVAELIEPLQRSGHMPENMRQSLVVWVDSSNRYLRQPRDPARATVLIEQLNRPEWGSPFTSTERDILYRALLLPFMPEPQQGLAC